jgi:hypothetical protein
MENGAQGARRTAGFLENRPLHVNGKARKIIKQKQRFENMVL